MKKNIPLKLILLIIILFPFIVALVSNILKNVSNFNSFDNSKNFRIISSTSNKFMEDELQNFAKENKINLSIEYYGDLEIVDKLNEYPANYDAVWISNSIWLYMLDNTSLVTDSKSIAIDPVVMSIKKSKAESLGLIDKDIYNYEILDLIKNKELKYVMANVTKTNTGATAYLGFLNSLAGSPEVLSSEMISEANLIKDMKTLFTGVERVSGNEDYLEKMFLNGDYDAIVNYESSLIELNKTLINENREPLYLLYPIDGVAINDMPFGYVNNNQNKKDIFEKIQKFLRSEKTAEKLELKGFRTWYGGTNEKASTDSFKKEWGIDTSKYLIPLKYPSKKVITEAMDLYIENLRKPTHTVFCLDISGSMSSGGLSELKNAMNYILDREQARKDKLQFSTYDKISIITFNSRTKSISKIYNGDDTEDLLYFINHLVASGGTNIYEPTQEALKILLKTSEEYIKTVILMTDGESNSGSFSNLKYYYNYHNMNVPIYSIMFGSSEEYQLEPIAELSNAKVFNGKDGLKKAFMEVRSYN